MKTCVLCLVCAAALCAQVAVPQVGASSITHDTVVARIDGHDVTQGDIEKILQDWPQQFAGLLQQDPATGLRQIYTLKYLGAEGEKRGLADESPLKEQIAIGRALMLAQAETTWERNHFPVSEDDIKNFYEKNKTHYEQAKIRIIKIGLQEPVPLPHTQEDIQKAAQLSTLNARAPKRSEAEARALANEIIKKLHAGGDFAALAKQYSDDADTKDKGGDFGVLSSTSSYPEEMKNAVFATKTGEVSEPVRMPNSLYLIRVDEVTYPPLEKLHEDIIAQIRNEHLKSMGADLGKRFKVEIVRPEVFLPNGAPPKQ